MPVMDEERVSKMLIINKMDKVENEKTKDDGEWFDRELWGVTIRCRIRARTEAVVKRNRDKFKGMKEGKKKEELILDALYEYLLAEFEGLAEELPDGTVQRLEMNQENIKKFLYMPVPTGEQPNWLWLVDRANERAFEVREIEKGNF